MKFEIKGKTLTCCGIAMMIVAMDLIMVRIYVKHTIQPVRTCIAVHDIHSEEIIESKDISEITVPKKYILTGTVMKKEELEGRICRKDAFIPAGSLFYEALLK